MKLKADLKTIAVAVTLALTLGSVAYKSVLKVQQVGTNTKDIRTIESISKLDKLCRLHRKALSDYYYWNAECQKTRLPQACQNALAAKSRVDRLEKQIQKLEETTGQVCG